MNTTDVMPTSPAPGVLRAGTLTAEFALGRSHVTGDWIAVATVRSDEPPKHLPGWILIGYGTSQGDAIGDLHCRLEDELLRFKAWKQDAFLLRHGGVYPRNAVVRSGSSSKKGWNDYEVDYED